MLLYLGKKIDILGLVSATFSDSLVKHIAKLSNLSVSDEETADFARAFNDSLPVIEKLNSLDTTGIEPTHQVTELENNLRVDQVDSSLSFTQEEALRNAKRTYQGYFVVDRLIDQD